MATATNIVSSSVGIPVKLLHEGEGHTVTVELKNGELYRGLLNDSEDSMNCQLSNVTMTKRNGQVSKLEIVYLRGSQIKMVIMPDLLKNAPMFKKVQALKSAMDQKNATSKRGGKPARKK